MATSMIAFALLTTMASSALAGLVDFPMTATVMMPREDPGVSTCGYLTGNPDKAREANSGFDCRSYSTDGSGLWGFCPTGMAIASDCSFAAACYDSGSCTSGCGIMTSGLYSITCDATATGASFCSIDVLTDTTSAVYSYIACGRAAGTGTYLQVATTESSSSTSSSASAAASTSISSATSTAAAQSSSSTASSSTSPSTATTANASSSASSTSSSKSSSSSSNTGAIAGGVVGGIAIICITTLVGFFLLRKSRRNRQSGYKQSENGYTDTPPRQNHVAEMQGDSGYSHQFNKQQSAAELPAWEGHQKP